MRKLQRHRRSLTWIASLASAVTVATVGATAVMAEGPACVVDGTPITHEQAAADPDLCPAAEEPAAPAPAPDPEPAPEPEPAPDPDPAPTSEEPPAADPAPADPADSGDAADPAPTEDTTDAGTAGGGTEPAPTEDATDAGDPGTDDASGGGTEPAAEDPAPADPTPTSEEPATQEPTATEPAPTTDDSGTGNDPATTTPTTPKPTAPKPAAPKPQADPPADPITQHTRELVRAKQYQAAPFRDARTFRENYEPTGRIPRQPELSQEDATTLLDAARGTATSWSTLAAVAWLESRWDDPTAGGIVGRRLTDAAWAQYGTDGDGDGIVSRDSRADQARTVAIFLARVSDDEHEALRAYFNYSHREIMADRAELLADYFDALGPYTLVHGIDDPEAREKLQERTLDDETIEIYDAGRSDIEAGIIDPRVLVTLRYLANRYESVTVSSLVSGHGVFTTSGNVSLHAYGQAVDIAALGGESILGNQQKDGKTYEAVKDVLLLPAAMQPAELISLWDMGGASFAMSDHHDHIHIGWKTDVVPEAGGDDHRH